MGRFQYETSLDLSDGEVVLTFDDGPHPRYTPQVLKALATECVNATFFVVGAMVAHSPQLVRQVYEAGHSVGTHTQTHPHLPKLPFPTAQANIRQGIAAAKSALTDTRPLSPFFRAPYLELTPALETYLASEGLMIWSVDFHVRDWDKISPDVVVSRVMDRLRQQRKGILLLHDIQPHTARALPSLLKALKAGGYRVVHVMARQPSAAP